MNIHFRLIHRSDFMTILKFKFENINGAEELIQLSESNENIELIQEKNFSGDITTIELYVSLGINVIAVLVPVIKKLIDKQKISGLTIDGDKIEVKNVSEKLIEEVITKKLENNSDK